MSAVERNHDLASLVSELFADLVSAEVVARTERVGFDADLWHAVADLGFPLVGIDEGYGGAGGTLLDLLVVLQAAGQHAVPLPLAETSLAAWLLTAVGQDASQGPMTVIPDTSGLALRDERLDGTAPRVPWGACAEAMVGLLADAHGRIRLVRCDPIGATVVQGRDLAGMPCDSLTFSGVEVESWPWPRDADDLLMRGALLRAAQLAGAIRGAFELTRDYTTERQQFGRALSKFQSVQAHIVELAQAATTARLCVDRAGSAAMRGPACFEILATKAIAGREAARAAAAAHQAHGAIGMTREYPLQLLTRRLHAWRGEYGDELALNARIGAAAVAGGDLVDLVTSTDQQGRM